MQGYFPPASIFKKRRGYMLRRSKIKTRKKKIQKLISEKKNENKGETALHAMGIRSKTSNNALDEVFEEAMDIMEKIRMTEGKSSFDDTFLKMARLLGILRGSCNRGRAAAIFVDDNHSIISEGYVGSLPKDPECDEVGHQMMKKITNDSSDNPQESTHCVRTIHAEENGILSAARRGVSLTGSTVYVTMTPCRTCAAKLVAVGVKRVVAQKLYPKHSAEVNKLFQRHNIELTVINPVEETYSDDN